MIEPQPVGDDDWLAGNRGLWEEWAAAHAKKTSGYNLDGVLAGHSELRPWELAEVGSVAGVDLLHLQCHIGTDTLSWAMHGAKVTGLDFSPTALEAGASLADRAGLEAEWICSDVYDAVEAAAGRTWDVVYTGVGALSWLPDLDRWAEVVRDLLRPGGCLYLMEIHPMATALADDGRTLGEHAIGAEFSRWSWSPDEGSYAAPDARFEHTDTYERLHGLGDLFSAVLGAGLTVELFHEFDVTNVPTPWLVKGDDDLHRFPEGAFRLPLLYSLKARRPE